jgi:hypothetical protein
VLLVLTAHCFYGIFLLQFATIFIIKRSVVPILEQIPETYEPSDISQTELDLFADFNRQLTEISDRISIVNSTLPEKETLLNRNNTEMNISVENIRSHTEWLKSATVPESPDRICLEGILDIVRNRQMMSLNEVAKCLEYITWTEQQAIKWKGAPPMVDMFFLKQTLEGLQAEFESESTLLLRKNIADLRAEKAELSRLQKQLTIQKSDMKRQWQARIATDFMAIMQKLLPITLEEIQKEEDQESAKSNLGLRFKNCINQRTAEPISVTFEKLAKLSQLPISIQCLNVVRSVIEAHERNMSKIEKEQLTPARTHTILPANLENNDIEQAAASLAPFTWLLHPQFWQTLGLSLLAVGVIMLAMGSSLGAVSAILGTAIYVRYRFFTSNQPLGNQGSVVAAAASVSNQLL